MLEEPAQEPIPELAQSHPTLVALVVEGVLLVLRADGQVEMRPGARPVRERLLLVLPDRELYDYLCTECGSSVGSREVKAAESERPSLII